MKAQQLSSKADTLTETASYTNKQTCDGAWRGGYEVAGNKVEPTMFMKAEQLSTKSGTLAELQVTQNKQLTMGRVGRSAK